jgi:zinc protease
MNRILGGSAGLGRLFNYVRDVQGLAYGVWSSFSVGLGEGPFIARAGVNPQNVELAIQSILNEISRLRNDGITEQELADAKEMLIGNFALSMETSSGIADVLLTSEMFELGLDYPKRHEQIYRAITKEQVEQAAREYLHPEKCSLVIAGPYTELGMRNAEFGM